MKRTLVSAALLAASCQCAWAAGFEFGPYRSAPTGSWATAVAVGDVNGDRLEDVVLATTFYFDEANDYQVFVYPQRYDGFLAPPLKFRYGEFANRASVKLADLNEDGTLDIVVGHDGGISLLLSDGSGGFAQRAHAPGGTALTVDCGNLAILDVNLDGHLDIVGQSWSDGATIFYGDGLGGVAGTAFMATGAAGYNDIKVGDVTNDGYPDLVVASLQSPNFYVYPHDRKHGFAAGVAYPLPDSWWAGSVAIGDFDSDGSNDVVLATPANDPHANLYFYAQDAAGRLLPTPRVVATYQIPNALLARDLDRDGRQDLLVGHMGWLSIGRYMQGEAGLDAFEQMTVAPFNQDSSAMATGDFNDDGCTDVAIADYGAGLVTLPGRGCERGRAAADFDGDGTSDILWRNAARGSNVIWRSADFARSQSLQPVSRSWKVAGLGDFDGDGRADILWHNGATGASVIWKRGAFENSQSLATVTNRAWEISAVADFDGDGRDDVFWRDAVGGRNAIWRSGDYRLQIPVVAVTDPAWRVVGTGDFDGNGKADLLWRDTTTGRGVLWPAADFQKRKAVATVPDSGWRVAGVGDFDGDGKDDILWRHAKGSNVIWKAADAARREQLRSASHEWAASIGDFDGNGKSDLLWRNTTTGQNMIWRAAIGSVPGPVADVSNVEWGVED